MKTLKESKILGIVGNALMLLSIFLPYYTVTILRRSESSSLMADSGIGFLFLILIVINFVMIFADKVFTKSKFFGSAGKQKLTLIPTGIILFLQIVLGIGTGEYTGKTIIGSASHGFGYWLLWFGLVASIVYPFLYKGKESSDNTQK